MSASAVTGAAKAVATKTNPGTSASSKTVYLFRHIQTSQVLVSLKNSVEKQSLKQITDETRRPAHVRPDHWHPLVAIQGFARHQDALAFHNSLRDHQLNMHTAKTSNETHMLQPRRLRAPQEMKQVDETLVKMVELLNEQPQIKANKGKGIHILWEREGVRKQLLEKDGVSLLEGIEHGDLVIRRGRDIVNA
ncbi:hypothetical protein BX616_006056 [Lobosporangium transversale]|uniref:Large ribosomal subunit protein mL67 n=1 Tax=Lobosporangium transversale TaxID=64571 RepID=A0A1Y2GA49_9FUNG|nr:hypothetical protein BCR41DRAFT_363185 [Lobosporangium transversale]KAF9915490.1 hypothetical protein BX616_006056 [Lobosporangium transversale]ORZ04087.1 hypothetical protein BCR41DRAFT_363185 [Lobosporangium transversale]|eukprot:XP_021876364.1 hypothetical protein BCR41DRAFT_363185 [Lobosporangium transversale]